MMRNFGAFAAAVFNELGQLQYSKISCIVQMLKKLHCCSFGNEEFKTGFIMAQGSLSKSQSGMLEYSQVCDPARQKLPGHLRLLVWGPRLLDIQIHFILSEGPL